MNAFIPNIWTFLALTIVIGGAGAFITGSVMAQTWREIWKTIAYMIPLTAAIRFLHYALFDEPSDLADIPPTFIFLTISAVAGFIHTRRRQMREQYPFLSR
ncbi:MAG: DUF6867 family protein [Rhodoblastus sp.]